MSTFDIRDESIEEIVFAEDMHPMTGQQAYALSLGRFNTSSFIVIEGEGVINSKEDALNLIKAINKAIELGWVK